MPPFHVHADVVLIMGSVEVLYLLALSRLGPRHVEPGERPATRRQLVCFSAGVLTLAVGALWPIHDLAERALYSVHMVQHLLFTLVAPPLLLLGTPDWLARTTLRPIWPVARVLLRPVPALLLFNALLVVTHWPLAVQLSLQHEPLHFLIHLVLVLSALVLWWPVLSPLAEIPRLSYPGQMLYLFLQSIVPTVPASFLTFGSGPLYPIYATFPRVFGISVLTDQRIAGLLMKIGGGTVIWTVIALVFFRWWGAEHSAEPDTIEWQVMERELNRRDRAARP